ncbi:hypothetical protein [Endozoicomonas sp. 4G]|uniref:hypothetical protein n=1 Tax=Endozoicomonas sp. 4G TaxID=2872754 RepID=UPI002078946B|nr:hypothetical protein [Endozoicomonas sp. 4G]
MTTFNSLFYNEKNKKNKAKPLDLHSSGASEQQSPSRKLSETLKEAFFEGFNQSSSDCHENRKLKARKAH